MKVIIAGGRDFTDYRFVEEHCNKVLAEYIHPDREMEIISGRCSTGKHTFTAKDGTKVYGVDGLAERYAEEMKELVGLDFKFTPFPANWRKYGRSAGLRRNKQMAEYAGPSAILIAFGMERVKGLRI